MDVVEGQLAGGDEAVAGDRDPTLADRELGPLDDEVEPLAAQPRRHAVPGRAEADGRGRVDLAAGRRCRGRPERGKPSHERSLDQEALGWNGGDVGAPARWPNPQLTR